MTDADLTTADAVELDHVSKIYRTGRRKAAVAIRAADDISLTLRAGSWTAIMGPSGSGKSTLLQLAAGLLEPDTGAVRLLGQPLAALPERARDELRRDHVGFVFQSLNLVPSLTAALNIELPWRLARRRVPSGLARDALARVGLADRARDLPEHLSGGQQQRVAIARALAVRPALLFADEPTGSLDSGSARAVLDLLAEVVAGGTCLVMVTHDPAVAARAGRVAFLFDGRIVDQSPRLSAAEIAARLAGLEAAGESAAAHAAGRGPGQAAALPTDVPARHTAELPGDVPARPRVELHANLPSRPPAQSPSRHTSVRLDPVHRGSAS